MKKIICLLAALALLLSAPAARASDVPKKYLALTFDDGPSGELTEALLDRIEQFPDTLVRIASEGHEIGLHSSCHDYMQKLDKEAVLADLTENMQAVSECCGVRARLFRPPGGLYSEQLLDAAEELELSVILWSVDPCDWDHAAWDGVLTTVLSDAHDGGIILMHDLSEHSVRCALQAVDRLQAQGYTFCTVSELARLRGTALVPGQVYSSFPAQSG